MEKHSQIKTPAIINFFLQDYPKYMEILTPSICEISNNATVERAFLKWNNRKFELISSMIKL